MCRESIFQLKQKIEDRDYRIKQNGRANASVIRVSVELKDRFNQTNKQISEFE